jgi:hypothetical protein
MTLNKNFTTQVSRCAIGLDQSYRGQFPEHLWSRPIAQRDTLK